MKLFIVQIKNYIGSKLYLYITNNNNKKNYKFNGSRFSNYSNIAGIH